MTSTSESSSRSAPEPPSRVHSLWQAPSILAHLQDGVEEYQLVLHQLGLLHEPKMRAGQLNPLEGSSVLRRTRGGGARSPRSAILMILQGDFDLT